jgi:hypothetical protein
MPLQKDMDMTVALLQEKEEITVIQKKLTVAGMSVGKAALCIRIAQARIMEGERLESATLHAVELLSDKPDEHAAVLAIGIVEGAYIAAKAVFQAKKRLGIS